MKSRLLFLILALGLTAKAQTMMVEGLQSGTWDADTVLVTGDVQVMDSLRILPGTTVVFKGFFGIEIGKNASFLAEGTMTDSIVFTVADTTGFSNYESLRGGWDGIKLLRSGSSLLDYCVLEYGKAFSENDWNGGALQIIECNDVAILHSTLRHCAAYENGGALSAEDSKVKMLGCTVEGNTLYNEENLYIYGGGARFLKCDVEMSEMTFRNNIAPAIGGALSLDSCSVNLDRSVFVDNVAVNGGGLYLMRSNDRVCKLSNLLFDHNFSQHFGGGFALADVSPEISNVLVTNNESAGVNCQGIFFYQYCAPILRNCIIYGNYPSPEYLQGDTAQMWVWTFEDYAPEFYNCVVEGGLEHIHSYESISVFEAIDVDPMFVDAAHHDFRLAQGSPCIDAGSELTPQYVLDGLDLGGLPRVINHRVDIGPYEYSPEAVPETTAPFAQLLGNPLNANSHLVMNLDVAGEVNVTVFDMAGRRLSNMSWGGQGSLGLGDLVAALAPGVYFLEVTANNKTCCLKAVR